ncbi:MAG: transposase [Pirellulaceae bacterium]
MIPLQTFDPKSDFSIIERSRLPHWVQAGTVCFITWRTWDSLPEAVVERWLNDRRQWLRQHGINPISANWRRAVSELAPERQSEFREFVSTRFESELDQAHGECVLRQQELSQIVSQSLLYFDEQRYVMTDFVVMPNHVHLLAAFATEEGMLQQCDSWKYFTATQINRRLACKGRFWQEDQFDHLVRSPEDFSHFRSYIAENPKRARLRPGEYIHFTKDLSLRMPR